MISLKANERIDDLQRGGCRIIQNSSLFCFGMDAVLLSAFAQVKTGSRVLDLCSGNGIIPILLDARHPEKHLQITGIEINSICVDMSRRSAEMNQQSERIHFLEGDIREAAAIAAASFDSVTVNPPYMTGGAGLTGDRDALTNARHEILCTIADTAAAAARALKMNGRLYMVHRPHRLSDIYRALSAEKLEIKRIRMVHPFADKEANMVLIEAVKGGRSYVHVEPPLIVYKAPGEYTEEVRKIYFE